MRLAGYEPGALTAELQGRREQGSGFEGGGKAAARRRLATADASSVEADPYDPAYMLLVTSSILGLGESPSAFGQTLALILTFIVVIGGVVNFLIGYIVSMALVERKQNQQRMREYDARHKS